MIGSPAVGPGRANGRVRVGPGGGRRAGRPVRALASGSAATGLSAVAKRAAAAGREMVPAGANRALAVAVRTPDGGRARLANATRPGRAAGMASVAGTVSVAGTDSAAPRLITGRGAESRVPMSSGWRYRTALPLTSWIRKPWRSCVRYRGTWPVL